MKQQSQKRIKNTQILSKRKLKVFIFLTAYGKLEYSNLCSSGNKDNGLCKFDTAVFGECLQNDYGFQLGTPCLFFRLNQVFFQRNLDFRLCSTTC